MSGQLHPPPYSSRVDAMSCIAKQDALAAGDFPRQALLNLWRQAARMIFVGSAAFILRNQNVQAAPLFLQIGATSATPSLVRVYASSKAELTLTLTAATAV